MKARYIDIVKKWAFVFAYGIGEDDVEDVGDWLEALGASRREIARACRVILGTNKGFTYSNSDLRMSVVCISHASSREQWWDTVAHEVDHLQAAILDYYQVAPGTEDAAWLQGYLVRQIVKVMHNA